MKYRKLGNNGVKLSVVSIGNWLTYGMGIDDTTALKCMQTALDNGIIFYDTADIYNKGEAEKTLGRVLFDEIKIRREDVVIASKCFWPMSPNPNDQGLSRKHITESVHKSLKRIKTDYIDIYQIQKWDRATPIEETIHTLDSLVQSGKVRYLGSSNVP